MTMTDIDAADITFNTVKIVVGRPPEAEGGSAQVSHDGVLAGRQGFGERLHLAQHAGAALAASIRPSAASRRRGGWSAPRDARGGVPSVAAAAA